MTDRDREAFEAAWARYRPRPTPAQCPSLDYVVGWQDALAHARAAQVHKPVSAGWQRRLLYETAPGSQAQWEQCSAHEATDMFARSPRHEYRQVYTHPAPAQEPVAPTDDPDFVQSLQGFASMCESSGRTGGMSPEDCDLVAGKLRDACFVIDELQKLRDGKVSLGWQLVPASNSEEVADPDWLPFAAQWGGYALLLQARKLCEAIEKLPGGLDQSALIERVSEVAFALQQFQMRGEYRWRPIPAPVSPAADSGDMERRLRDAFWVALRDFASEAGEGHGHAFQAGWRACRAALTPHTTAPQPGEHVSDPYKLDMAPQPGGDEDCLPTTPLQKRVVGTISPSPSQWKFYQCGSNDLNLPRKEARKQARKLKRALAKMHEKPFVQADDALHVSRMPREAFEAVAQVASQWNAGAEAMREACADYHDRAAAQWRLAGSVAMARIHERHAKAIRALPLPTPAGEG